MEFTDKDLKELVSRLNYHASMSDWSEGPFKISEIQSLIARLEAAEAYINAPFDRCNNCDDIPKSSPEQNKAYELWRKSAGKGER